MKAFKRKTVKKTEGANIKKSVLNFLKLKAEIRLRRPPGQISHPFLLKNDEKGIFEGEIRLRRPPGQISQPFLVKNDEK